MIEQLTGVLSKITVGFFYLWIFFSGVVIGGTALHDPDTCWIVSLGKFIFDHGSIPVIEPFSYTFVEAHRPLVLYQWMSELSFYLIVRLTGLKGLLVLVTVLVMIAFVITPMKLFQKVSAPWHLTLPTIVLAMASANFHFLARPEIVSYIFLSISMLLLSMHRSALTRHGNEELRSSLLAANLKLTIIFVFIMAVWANFHTGFISVLCVFSCFLLGNSLSRLIFGVSPICDGVILLALIFGAIATLCNPYSFGLWYYIPSLFFANFNNMIHELLPIDIQKKEFTPFILFLIGFGFVWTKKFMFLFNNNKHVCAYKIEKIRLLESSFIFAICALEACNHLRLIPFAVIVLLYELALLFAIDLKQFSNPLIDLFNSKLEAGLAPQLRLGSLSGLTFILIIGVTGTLIGCKIQAPMLPQSNGGFKLPLQAITVLNAHHADARILNDPQFGDAIIWYHPSAPKVFIDTRFDMYGEHLVQDYLDMTEAKPGWQNLIDKYGIKVVFLSSSSPLLKKLRSCPPWLLEYSGEESEIFSRP